MGNSYHPNEVVQCFLCQFDVSHYCHTCGLSLCFSCKQSHDFDLSTADHDVVNYRNKYAYKPIKIQPKHIKETIYKIRSETLFVRQNLLKDMKNQDKTYHTAIVNSQKKMQPKANLLKMRIDSELPAYDYSHMTQILQEHALKIISELTALEMFEHDMEQSKDNPVTFLLDLKKSRLFDIGFAPDFLFLRIPHTKFSFSERFKSKSITDLLCEIKIRQTKTRHLEKKLPLKLIDTPIVQKNVIMESLNCCLHISCVTPELFCVSDEEKTLLTNTHGQIVKRLEDFGDQCGTHTVNNEKQLIYIDKKYDINILSIPSNSGSTFIKGSDSTWRSRCLNYSQSTGTLIVGMCRENPQTGKVVRYDHSGKQIQTIQHGTAGLNLYKSPIYITENTNKDVVVTDWFLHAVVVTDSEGTYRFSYTGYPIKSELRPRGIATDVFGHILVCDSNTDTVQIIDKNGNFISYLVIDEQKLIKPRSLCYDTNNHLLWVGSWTNVRMLGYRFINRQDPSHGKLK